MKGPLTEAQEKERKMKNDFLLNSFLCFGVVARDGKKRARSVVVNQLPMIVNS
jgi:hypothetical protein